MNELSELKSEKDSSVLIFGERQTFSLAPRNFSEAMEFSKLLAGTDLVPANFRNKPANILVVIQMGAEVGLHPMQAIQNTAVINGRPSLWGDALLALVQKHASFEWIEESQTEEKAICAVKRKGSQPHTVTFTKEDAIKAGLWGKPGPWRTYTKRMLQMRARGFALRDMFSDALHGFSSAEEQLDIVNSQQPESKEPAKLVTEDQLYMLNNLLKTLGKTEDYVKMILEKANVSKMEELTEAFVDKWLVALDDQVWTMQDEVKKSKEEKEVTNEAV